MGRHLPHVRRVCKHFRAHTRTRVLSSSFQLRTWAAPNAIRLSPRAFNFSHRQIKPKHGVRAIGSPARPLFSWREIVTWVISVGGRIAHDK